jgi:hypothetical protein
LSHGIEWSPNKEGKKFVKFVDGLGILPEIRSATTATELVSSGLDDLYDLLTEILALQQSQKRFWYAFDPVDYILFETNLSCTVPFGNIRRRHPFTFECLTAARFRVFVHWIEPNYVKGFLAAQRSVNASRQTARCGQRPLANPAPATFLT